MSTMVSAITFYTDVDLPASRLAAWRLQQALSSLGYCLNVEQLSSRRSLQMANDKPAGELVRVASIHTLQPEFTHNLLRLEVPTVEVGIYRIKPLALIPLNGRFAIPQGAFILAQRYPQAMQVDGIARMMELLRRQRVDYVYTLSLTQDEVQQQIGLDGQWVIESVARIPLYSYLNVRHRALVGPLSEALRIAQHQVAPSPLPAFPQQCGALGSVPADQS
ncbi:hypothetical protein LJ739_09440 [Aestuariibacter halophilus]|uniref:Uncharacterized protein n=1 Tax=Fluctibacter halophilus TaxID=226011 RepID=A0ABS8G793_9ALTE|nr:hypothetical protein [Aestuariibacter halophilus]MCC2616462.1 hypothetical protein [Aestuariibacter halophilus]